MSINIKTRLYTGFTVAILLVMGVGFISYTTFTKQYAEAARVKHSYKVVNQLTFLQNLLVDMETGRRGFRSTDNKKFLEPYNNALTQIGPAINETKLLVSDNIDQLDRLNKLSNNINELLNYWRSLGDNASKYTREIISGINDAEKEKMDVVRSRLNAMMNVEQTLLSQREAANLRSVNVAITGLVLGILLILVIVGFLIYLILHEFKIRTQAEFDLKDNNKKLELINKASEEKNWLLAGLARVNNSLQGVQSTNEICNKALHTIVEYLNLDAAAIYLYKDDSNTFELTCSLGLTASAKKTYLFNEGFIGRAAAGTQPLQIKNIPKNYLVIEGGVLNIEATEIIYAPLRHNSETNSVLELCSFKPFSHQHIALFNLIDDIIAVAINSSQSRERVLELLEQVQQQKEELENQQEELRQANEELNIQTEVLQTSEEELRMQEEELRQINHELNQKNEDIEKAREALITKTQELEKSNQYKSEFLANMSHELRTPLNSVLILARLLADNNSKNLTEKQVTHAQIIHKSGSDLLRLINDILDLSKIESGKADLMIEEVNLESLAQDMKQIFEVVANEKSIEFTILISGAAPKTVQTDKQKLEQILKNLLSNALKFTSAKGKVQLQFLDEAGGQYFNMIITDSGIGISENKQQIIFEAFQQADGATNRKYGGTGLGLSITRQLVKLLQGTINVKSKEEIGSTFTVKLPVQLSISDEKTSLFNNDVEVQTAPGIPQQTIIKDDRNDLSANDKVMLIIEDDPAFATILRDASREKGFKTIIAVQGDEGLFYANKYLPGAILLDMQLPVLNGSEVLKQLKNTARLKHIPVHIFSASIENKMQSVGAVSFLQKPLSYKDISEAILFITGNLQSSIKKVLLIAGAHIQDHLINQLFRERNFDVECKMATTLEEGILLADTGKYDCSIADVGNHSELNSTALVELHKKLSANNTPLIVYLDKDIFINDELALRKISEVIVRQSSGSHNRLMDELELFLYKVQGLKSTSKFRVNEAGLTDNELAAKKVLLVDDDMRNVFALSAALELEEIHVITASDGKEALNALQNNNGVDLVLMDIMMPEMDGYEAIRHIRNDLKLTRLPIIALTAKAMTGDREKCIQAGASDYISKPVDIQKLLSLMRVWLS
ncbi:MAG: response regulator [Chitinophagaceae bacterium]|nr:response regulator [Chitinophagaceae bacterium]